MKVLLDECVNHGLRKLIVGHDVFTSKYMGWDGLRNGRLLATAAGGGFTGMVTTDQGIELQQNLNALPLTIYVMYAESGKLEDLLPLMAKLLAALGRPPVTPQVVHIRA